MNQKFNQIVNLCGNASQIVIAGSILADLYWRIRDHIKPATSDPDIPVEPIADAA